MADFVGWVGSVLFAICGAPQAVKSIRQGHSHGVSPWFLGFWLTGELCYVYSTIAKFGLVSWLIFNYIGNILFVLVIIYFAVFPRRRPMILEERGCSEEDSSDPIPGCATTASTR